MSPLPMTSNLFITVFKCILFVFLFYYFMLFASVCWSVAVTDVNLNILRGSLHNTTTGDIRRSREHFMTQGCNHTAQSAPDNVQAMSRSRKH